MRYVVRYRPESKPRQEVSHLERTLHLDMVCRHRNQLIDRTKSVYYLKNSNNKDQGFIFNSSLSRQHFKIYEINSVYKSFNVDCYLVSIIFFCYTITNHQFHKEISNTLLLQRCALRKFHVTDGQNRRDQITCNRRSKLA